MSTTEEEREKLVNPEYGWRTQRTCDYAFEILQPIEVDEADRERGLRFVEAIRALHSRTEGVFSGMETIGDHEPILGVKRGGVIIIEPVYAVRRFVKRGDPFYEYQSPNELSYSTRPILVEYFQFFEPNEHDDPEVQTEGAVAVRAHSPRYKGQGRDGQNLVEVTTLDLLAHPLAIHPIDGYMHNRWEVDLGDEELTT